MAFSQRGRAFTLIELMVVVSVIALLSSIVLVALQSARNKGRIASGVIFAKNLYHANGDRLVASWKFDTATSASAPDDSGNNHTLTLVNSPTLDTDTYSNVGKSLSLNGTSQYGYVNRSTDNFNFGYSPVTISVWVKPTAGTFDQVILHYGNNFILQLLGGMPYFGMPLSSFSIMDWDHDLRDGKWHQLTVTSEAVFANNHLGTGRYRFYLDGKVVGDNQSFGANLVPDSNATLAVGVFKDSSGSLYWYFNGKIDDVEFYPVSVVAEDVWRLYVQGRKTHPLARSDSK